MFFEHIVRCTVEGRQDNLKERLLGVEVFKRAVDYDTNTDPVVRMTAGEVRKRIAQYYHDPTSPADFRIDLDPGTYIPEFQPNLERPTVLEAVCDAPAESLAELSERKTETANAVVKSWLPSRPRAVTFIVVLLLFAGLGAKWVLNRRANPLERVWIPFLTSEDPPLILVGLPHSVLAEANEEQTAHPGSKDSHSHIFVALSDAIALAHVAGEMDSRSRSYRVQLAASTPITYLRKRPVILIGANNNPWTIRLTQELPFYLESVTLNGEVQTSRIVDRKNPSSQQWQISETEPAANRKNDFAIVARYQSPLTRGPVMIVAGLGFNATEGAGEVVVSNDQLKQIESSAPHGWDGKNFEAVVEVSIVDGRLASSKIVTARFWK